MRDLVCFKAINGPEEILFSSGLSPEAHIRPCLQAERSTCAAIMDNVNDSDMLGLQLLHVTRGGWHVWSRQA